jgi:hypothetical protein
MKIGIDDWHFQEAPGDMLVLDLFLDNGQHAVMEVNPMKNRTVANGDVPEIIVFCELPGEKLSEQGCPARWVSRPPSRECSWSGVQMPAALMEQLRVRLAEAPVPLPA